MKKFILLLIFNLSLFANLNFPTLSGVIVDEANLLSYDTKISLQKTMLENEENTTNQFVIATIKSLNNKSIEEYSLELARHWKLGQKDKNNGVLLLVAPNEREVRIEVGYGLEGVLTDAMAGYVIENFIISKFKENDYQGGIKDGALEILKLLKGDVKGYEKHEEKLGVVMIFIVLFCIFSIVIPIGLLLESLLTIVMGGLGFCLAASFIFFSHILHPFLGSFSIPVLVSAFIALFVWTTKAFMKEVNSPKKNYNKYSDYSSSSYLSSSSSSSYSGGGGSFGGGGASGSW